MLFVARSNTHALARPSLSFELRLFGEHVAIGAGGPPEEVSALAFEKGVAGTQKRRLYCTRLRLWGPATTAAAEAAQKAITNIGK